MGTAEGAVARPPRTPVDDATLKGKLAIGEGPTRSEEEVQGHHSVSIVDLCSSVCLILLKHVNMLQAKIVLQGIPKWK